jgi:hypothetical protein
MNIGLWTNSGPQTERTNRREARLSRLSILEQLGVGFLGFCSLGSLIQAYYLRMSSRSPWPDLLPNRWSTGVMAVAVVIMEYLFKKGILRP